jgi:hypothetical protein
MERATAIKPMAAMANAAAAWRRSWLGSRLSPARHSNVTERAASPRLAPLLEEVRAHCPPLTAARGLAGDVERLTGHFTQSVFGDEPLLP